MAWTEGDEGRIALTGDSEAGFLTLLETLEVIGISLTTSIAEKLTLLRDGVVIIALNVSSAGTLFHLKEAHGWKSGG